MHRVESRVSLLTFAAAVTLSSACGTDNAAAGAQAAGISATDQGAVSANPAGASGQTAVVMAGHAAAQPTGVSGAAGLAQAAGAGRTGAGAGAATGGAGVAGSAAAGSGGQGAAGQAGSGATAGQAGTSAANGGSGGGDNSAGAPSSSAPVLTTQTLIPHKSWDCGMPEGIPDPKTGDPLFEAQLQVGDVHDIGDTQYGHRLQIDIAGGTLTGAKIKADFLKRGLDYELTLANGALEDEQINILKTSDGSSIYFRTCGTSPGPGSQVRVTFDFEAPTSGAYAFLNTGKFIGIREFDATKKTLTLSAYEAKGTAAMTGAITVVEPDGVPDQTWDCKLTSGSNGKTIYTEAVGIADGSVMVGASKRGTRNIIPITGGTTSGMIEGMVFDGGADYQLLGDQFVLDARYTLKTNDGEQIIVRNCGPVGGGLVPVFETRTAGKYAWLNANTWRSSDPNVGANVVNLIIYQRMD
jgi:Protein of unknown function (DUF3237)